MFHSRLGRSLAYIVALVGCVVWAFTLGTGAAKTTAATVLMLTVAAYLVGAGVDKFRIEKRRRAAVRRANREGL